MVLTFGTGAQGCLGHGDFEDNEHARIIEPLLGYEITQVTAESCQFSDTVEIACGSSHVFCLTSEDEVETPCFNQISPDTLRCLAGAMVKMDGWAISRRRLCVFHK